MTRLPTRYHRRTKAPLSRPPRLNDVESVEIRLANGDMFIVDGAVEEIEKALSDAARSGQSRLAWFTESGDDRRLGLNASQVVSVRAAES